MDGQSGPVHVHERDDPDPVVGKEGHERNEPIDRPAVMDVVVSAIGLDEPAHPVAGRDVVVVNIRFVPYSPLIVGQEQIGRNQLPLFDRPRIGTEAFSESQMDILNPTLGPLHTPWPNPIQQTAAGG